MLPPPPPSHNFILFKLDFDIKFPLLRLLLFLSDLKSTTVTCIKVEITTQLSKYEMRFDLYFDVI